MAAAVFLLLILIKKIYVKNWYKGISANIDVSANATYPGREIMLTETIVNRKWLPLPMITVKFEVDKSFVFGNGTVNTNVSDHCYKSDVFSLLFYQKITRKLPLICTKRGFFRMTEITVVSTDVMMDATLVTSFPLSKTITVYPEEIGSEEADIPYNRIMGTVLTKRYAYEDPFEFRGIREYQTYDTMKSINWTASARTGDLKVNIHDYTAAQQVCILLNLENEGIWEYEELKEKSISMACSLAFRLTRQGVAVCMISNGRDKITDEETVIGSGCDESHRKNIMTQLARIDLKKQPRDFEITVQDYIEEMEKGAVFCMISTSKREAVQTYYEELSGRTQGAVWIYPMHKGFDTQFAFTDGADVICWEVED